MSQIQKLTDSVSIKFTEQTLLDILKKKTGYSDVQIKNIDFGEESKKGDSYLSTILRFCVTFTGKNNKGETQESSLPIIVKCIPKNEDRRKTFRSVDFFQTEIIFYEKVWPVMKNFVDSKNLSEQLGNIVPLCLSASSDPEHGYIAMEDLSYQGFGGVEKSNGLDYDHSILVLRLLAKFHAISIALKNQNPGFEDIAQSLKETYFAEKFRNWYSGFEKTMHKVYRHAVSTQLPPKYLEKMNKLFETDLFGTLCELCKVKNKFSAVTQGDSWIPNFLVKYNQSKKPLDVVMIDFQLARYTSLSNDVLFVLYTCVCTDILEDNFNHFIEEYHKSLCETIVQLGSGKDLITLDELKEDIQKHALFGVGMSMEAIIMSLLEEHEVADLDDIKGETPLHEVWIIPPFKDVERNKRLSFMFKHAIDQGFL